MAMLTRVVEEFESENLAWRMTNTTGNNHTSYNPFVPNTGLLLILLIEYVQAKEAISIINAGRYREQLPPRWV